MIEGVVVKTLKPIADERGYLMEILRSDDPFFEKFGQTYITVVYPGIVKGWHYHKRQVDHFCVVKGMAKVVLYDDRAGSNTRGDVNEFFMGEKSPILLRIPAGVLHGMKGIGTEPAIIVNTPSELYRHDDPDEFRVHPHDNEVPYSWDRRDG
jgi:dTDP-4-dehydrorhamnose 3,5-epimerase